MIDTKNSSQQWWSKDDDDVFGLEQAFFNSPDEV